MEGYAPPVFPTFQGDPQAMYADRESTGDRDGTRADNNARIHPRSTYAGSKPDFAALARHYPALASYIQITEVITCFSHLPTTMSFLSTWKGWGDLFVMGTCAQETLGLTGWCILQAGASLDFKDEKATRELTRSLLHNDHRIDWWVPKGHLIPPLTNRLNYIHWIEDLLELSGPQGKGHCEYDPKAPAWLYVKLLIPLCGTGRPTVRGLDIGCGANCIYPLLGASTCGWRFVGTDITDVAVAWARRNVACNPGLRDLIEVMCLT